MPRTLKDRVRDLTLRLREVVRLVSLGCTLSEIATILDLKPNTIDVHKNSAMQTLGVSKTATLTRLAIKYRISPLEDSATDGKLGLTSTVIRLVSRNTCFLCSLCDRKNPPNNQTGLIIIDTATPVTTMRLGNVSSSNFAHGVFNEKSFCSLAALSTT